MADRLFGVPQTIRRVTALVLLTLMVLTLVGGMTALPAGAQDTCPEGTVLDPVTDTCVKPPEEPTEAPKPPPPTEAPKPPPPTEASKPSEPEPTEVPPTEAVTAVPTEAVVPSANIRLSIWKYMCPPGVDVRGLDSPALASVCSRGGNGIVFRMRDVGTGATQEQAVAREYLEFRLPGDAVTIEETVPAGYGVPRVFCVDTWYEDLNPLTFAEAAVTDGTLIRYDRHITDPEAIPGRRHNLCLWFNIPAPDGENTVRVNKWTCPPGTATDAVAIEAYTAACSRTTGTSGIEFTLSTESWGASALTDASGTVTWPGVPLGRIGITETVPAGYGDPVVFCGFESVASRPGVTLPVERIGASGGHILVTLHEVGSEYICNWFNIPKIANTTIVVHKYTCPTGTTADLGVRDAYRAACPSPHAGVDFVVQEGTTTRPAAATGGDGSVRWEGVRPGLVTIEETIPAGYDEPKVYCGRDTLAPVAAPAGRVEILLAAPLPAQVTCDWFNLPAGPGQITIIKATCPVDYDLHAASANPVHDCPAGPDGVSFTLSRPGMTARPGTTGDAVPSTVTWSDLEGGTYTVTEAVPTGTGQVFVLRCDRSRVDRIHPYPLSVGPELEIELAAGDKVTCLWFNVPGSGGDGGRLTIHKFTCPTGTFVSAVSCDTFEGGASFDLYIRRPDTGWERYIDLTTDFTTDRRGTLTIAPLRPGTYRIDEVGADWCFADTSDHDADGNITVRAGQETTVDVYNCDGRTTTTTIPREYPNTGADPTAGAPGSSALVVLVMGLTSGLVLVVARLRATGQVRRWRGRPRQAGLGLVLLVLLPLVATPPGRVGDVTAQDLAGTPSATPAATPCELIEGTGLIEWTPDDGSPDVAPEATPQVIPGIPLPCPAGDVPASIRIERAGVDAEVEILETIDGVMQEPTTPYVVSWYRESALLGSPGNTVLAGHLNYWGVPEGVFHDLGALVVGDEIVVTGSSGEVYRYQVEWVALVDATVPPDASVVGPTIGESLTLITCGGQWNEAVSRYERRTVVRATRIDG